MTWTHDKTLRFMAVFNISQLELSKALKVERSTIARMLARKLNFDDYNETITIFFEAKRQALMKEHEILFNFYKNYR